MGRCGSRRAAFDDAGRDDIVERVMSLADGKEGRSMSQPGRFTAGLPGSASEERVSVDVEAGAASGTGSRDSNAAADGLSTGGRQGADGLFRAVSLPPLPPRRPLSVTFHALQEWEGYVVEIGEEGFVARLVDLTAGARREGEEARIPISALSDDEAAKLREGSIFRWSISYERPAVGMKRRVSRVLFRDLGAMTESDRKAGEAWARETMRAFEPR